MVNVLHTSVLMPRWRPPYPRVLEDLFDRPLTQVAKVSEQLLVMETQYVLAWTVFLEESVRPPYQALPK